MIVLDTNVLSELTRSAPSATVTAWLARRSPADWYITAPTEAELWTGCAMLPAGKRRRALELAVDALLSDYRGKVLAFESTAAREYAGVVAARRKAGQPIGLLDAQIAAIARARGAALATRNVRDFAGCGVELIDPWANP